MNTLFLAKAQAAPAGPNQMVLVLVFVAFGLYLYFGMLRPQKKRQQERLSQIDRLKKGDRVVLVDGLHGKIDSINDDDNTVVVDADGIYLTFNKLAVRQIFPADSAAADDSKNLNDTSNDDSDSSDDDKDK